MHEWALAEAVAVAAVETAERERLREISSVTVRIGELQKIEREVFEFALQGVIAEAEPRLRGAAIALEIEPARFRCRPCGREWSLSEAAETLGQDEAESIHFIPELAHLHLRCPACGSPDFEVTQGRGVWLASLSGER